MTSNLKGRFEQMAEDQGKDPTKKVTEVPDPSSGWTVSGHSGGGHTGQDGKYKTKNTKIEVKRQRKLIFNNTSQIKNSNLEISNLNHKKSY